MSVPTPRSRRRGATLAVGLVSVAGVLAAGPAAAVEAPSPRECLTAECRGPWIYDDGWWGFEDDHEIEPNEPVREAVGTGSSLSAAMSDAFDEALDECPGGIKITGTDTEGSGSSWTFTLIYRCN